MSDQERDAWWAEECRREDDRRRHDNAIWESGRLVRHTHTGRVGYPIQRISGGRHTTFVLRDGNKDGGLFSAYECQLEFVDG